MPIEITNYITIDKISNNKGFYPGSNLECLIELNEGHSRPVWTVIKDNRNIGTKTSRLIPESPNSMLLDALLLVGSEVFHSGVLQDRLAIARAEKHDFIDLNVHKIEKDIYKFLPEVFEGFVVNIIALPGSTLASQSGELKRLGIRFRYFEEKERG
jgi:hypothetical protein